MKTETEKKKKKNKEILSQEKELEQKIENLQADLTRNLNIIKMLKEEREQKIEITKEVAAEHKLNYDKIVVELERVLNMYKILEIQMEEVQNELKILLEGSYKELLEIKKKKAELEEQHKSILEKEKKEYGALLKEIQQESHRINSKLYDLVNKSMDVFADAQFGDCVDEEGVDIAPLLKRIS